jgi:EAL domain-containing protein (putative c-di-GMP-specific phosphodiesterase class I)
METETEHTMSQKGGVYLESLVAKVSGWSDPEARLREAFAEDEFMLLGQSIVPLDAVKQMPFRVELLVRLLEEEVNLMPPGGFFPALEACNMMPTLDRWVVARAAAWWRERNGIAKTVLNVNLSPETLDESDFPEFVQAQLRECRMPAAGFCFELPVTDIASASPAFLASVEKLKATGCGLAVTGFDRDSVSLDALRMTGAPVVKIDGSMVRTVSEDPDAYSRVRSIHRLCSTAGVITIAEFVERPETVSKLREIGVDYVQGYGIARPEPLASGAPVRTVEPAPPKTLPFAHQQARAA